MMLSKSNGMLGGGIQKSYVPIYQIYFPIWLMTIHQMLSILRSNPFIDFAHEVHWSDISSCSFSTWYWFKKKASNEKLV